MNTEGNTSTKMHQRMSLRMLSSDITKWAARINSIPREHTGANLTLEERHNVVKRILCKNECLSEKRNFIESIAAKRERAWMNSPSHLSKSPKISRNRRYEQALSMEETRHQVDIKDYLNHTRMKIITSEFSPKNNSETVVNWRKFYKNSTKFKTEFLKSVLPKLTKDNRIAIFKAKRTNTIALNNDTSSKKSDDWSTPRTEEKSDKFYSIKNIKSTFSNLKNRNLSPEVKNLYNSDLMNVTKSDIDNIKFQKSTFVRQKRKPVYSKKQRMFSPVFLRDAFLE